MRTVRSWGRTHYEAAIAVVEPDTENSETQPASNGKDGFSDNNRSSGTSNTDLSLALILQFIGHIFVPGATTGKTKETKTWHQNTAV